MSYTAKTFKELEIGEEFWDYTEPLGSGDLFIKTSIEESIHKEGKFIVLFRQDDIIEVENE